jgi:hypothetical protein
MYEVAIGVYAAADSPELDKTLACLDESVPASTPRRVFLATIETDNSPLPGCLEQLAAECRAEVYVALESGAMPMPCWLEQMMGVFRRVPQCGLVGPSTNRAPGLQGVFRSHAGDAATNASAAVLRFGSAYRALKRREYLDEFCIGVRGALAERQPPTRRGAWLEDFSIWAGQGNYLALWACGAYVHRPPAAARRESEGAQPQERRVTVVEEFVPTIVPALQPAAERVTPVPFPEVLTAAAEEDAPLASCIMPTFNRRAFVPRALRSFLCQDYMRRELIVVDDGTDAIEDLLPVDPRVRYFRLGERQNVGAKRNFACQHARGTFVLHWDDDEWYAPSRIRVQVNALRNSPARVSGTSVAFFYNENSDRAFRYSLGGHGAGWMGALAYPLAVWKERPFDCVAIAEDVRFISRVPVSLRLDLRDPSLYVASIHSSNTSPKITTGSYWRAEPMESLRGFPGFAPIAASAGAVRKAS